MAQQLNKNIETDNEEVNLNQIVEQYAYYWRWFLFSVIFCLLVAGIYLKYVTPLYKVDAKILLEKEDKASGELSGLAELSSLTGGSGQSAFVMDQIEIIKSRRLLRKVIENGNFQNSYFVRNNFINEDITESESPIKVIHTPILDGKDVGSFILTILNSNSFSFIDEDGHSLSNVQFGKTIKTRVGDIIFVSNADVNKYVGKNIKIVVHSIESTVDEFQKNVTITPNAEKQSYVVNFSMTGPLISRAKDILNSIITQYNEDENEDNNKVRYATSKFIHSRLELIGRDLDVADQKVQGYKSSNHMTDLVAESQLNLKVLTEADKEVLEKQTQAKLVDYMYESMAQSIDFELLPTNIGLTDLSIEKNIAEYNKLVLERDDLLKSSTLENPVVGNLTQNIKALSQNLKMSLDNYRSVLQLSLKSSESQKNRLQSKIASIPGQELGFKEIARQQQTVEAIYLFLLQKREENEIKASARPDFIKVIDSAYGSNIPVSPKKSIVLLGAFLLGLMIPFATLYIRFLLDNKIQSRKDIEEVLSVPILVEVPSSKETIIKDNDRSSLAEAFRILRTNLSFMLGVKKKSSVIFVTSTTSGEGKSFVSTNLSRILAMSGKRVLLLGADIRSPKVLDYLGLSHLQHSNIGITQYLINPDMDIDSIIIKKPEGYQFDIIYSGYIAPNPAELLMNGHFSNIIEYGRTHYDYVIVDTAPVSLVTDTLLIADEADLTVYVTRANYLEKRMLNVPKELHQEGKLKNMAVVLNDVDFERGYGYGYGYGYGEQEKVTFKKKIRKFFKLK